MTDTANFPELQLGAPAPDFALPEGAAAPTLSGLKGRKVVIFFYPKAETPGCTQEACDLRDLKAEFAAVDTEIIGVSKDTPKKQASFQAKHGLTFPLVADDAGDICERYGVWKQKSMYGKTFLGIERSTFLLDSQGRVAALWRKVSVPGHADAVLAAAKDTA